MVSLLMQSRLGAVHDTVKEFGSSGSPLREAFYTKVSVQRVEQHAEFLFKELYGDSFGEATETILKDLVKKSIKKLKNRGYQIL